MAKRKVLKKRINYIIGELFTECLINGKNVAEENKPKVNELLVEILNTQNEFISRISHTQPGNVKGFYKKLIQDFNDKVNELIDAISKL